MANALRAGEPIGTVMGGNYEHMLRALKLTLHKGE